MDFFCLSLYLEYQTKLPEHHESYSCKETMFWEEEKSPGSKNVADQRPLCFSSEKKKNCLLKKYSYIYYISTNSRTHISPIFNLNTKTKRFFPFNMWNKSLFKPTEIFHMVILKK